MKINVYSIRAAALLAGGLLLFSANPALRAAEHKKEHGEKGHADMAKPASSAAALETIHKLHAELAAQIKGKQLKSVHETCEKLTAAANALPAVSKDLPADKLKRVEGSVKNLAKALDTLHDAADDGNQANSEKHLKTVDSLLTMISSQYPGMSDHTKKAH